MAKHHLFWNVTFWMMVLATLWLSLIPGDQVPSALSFWDKSQHAVGFAVLGFLGLMSYPGHVGRLLILFSSVTLMQNNASAYFVKVFG
jgi:hypothetical protein